MKSLFIGFILVMLDFDINLGRASIELLPDFIGYILVMNGLREMSAYSFHFAKAMPFAQVMTVYSLITFVVDLIGISAGGLAGFIAGVIGFIAMLVAVYIRYCVALGVIDIEHHYGYYLEGEKLKSAWVTSAISAIVSAALAITIIFAPIAFVVIIVGLIAHLRFFYQLYKAKNLFYDQVVFPR